MQKINEILLSFFREYIELPKNFFLELLKFGELKSYNKNEVLKHNDCIENCIRILISGGCGYFINKNDDEKCVYFIFENDIVIDYASFAFDIKTEIIIKTLENSIIFEISKNDYYNFLKNNILGEKIHRIGLELLYFDIQQHYFDILTLTATQRYIKLIEKQKNIAQKIDHKHIASFLGITPQSLSRLRKNLLHK